MTSTVLGALRATSARCLPAAAVARPPPRSSARGRRPSRGDRLAARVHYRVNSKAEQGTQPYHLAFIVIAGATAAKRDTQENIRWPTIGIQNQSNRAKRSLERSITIQGTCPENPSATAKMTLSSKPTLTYRTKRSLELSITIQATCRENPSKTAKMSLNRKPMLIAGTSSKDENRSPYSGT